MTVTPLPNPVHLHLKLGPGADLFASLREFLDAQNLERAYVLSTIGSLRKVVVNFPTAMVDEPEVGSVTLEGAYEINGISGEVWREPGRIRVHLHGSVTREAATLYGGGLGEGAVVLKLAEMVILGIPKE